MRKIIKITAFSFVLMTLLCLFASCRDQKPKKEVFQIFKEYDDVGFDADAYINAAKENGTYLVDKVNSVAVESTEGKLCEFMIKPNGKFFLWGVKYDSVENAKKAFKHMIEYESYACIIPDFSIVRVDNVVLWTSGDNTVCFKDELESITKSSAEDGMHELLFEETQTSRSDTDKTAEEVVDTLKAKGFDRVYEQNDEVVRYLLLNQKHQAINIYVYETDSSSYEECVSYWAKSHQNAKIVYSYKNGLLIAVIGVTVDPEPLLK